MKVTRQGNWLKFAIGWALSLGLRLVPFRPPNLEPILAIQMPFSKRFGVLASFLFATLNIALYDLITGKIGQWTVITALAYGLLAIWSSRYLRGQRTAWHYGIFAVVGTVLYDAVTGLTIGPLFFGQSFAEAFFGQIPFTAYHVLGNVGLALTISPLVDYWIASNKKLEIAFPVLKARPLI